MTSLDQGIQIRHRAFVMRCGRNPTQAGFKTGPQAKLDRIDGARKDARPVMPAVIVIFLAQEPGVPRHETTCDVAVI